MPPFASPPWRSLLAVACFPSLTLATRIAAQVTFTGLGAESSIALDVTDQGVVVGYGRVGLTSATQSFRWSAGAVSDLGTNDPWFRSTAATKISSDGSVIVGQEGDQAFRWTSGSGRVLLGIPDGSMVSGATGMSSDGSVVVGSGHDQGSGIGQAFRWTTTAGMAPLGFLPGTNSSHATDVSGDGSVVVGYGGLATLEAFRWTSDQGMTGLGSIAGAAETYSYANAISEDGSTIVGLSLSPTGYQAFRWTDGGGMVGLGDDSGLTSVAFGVSGDGSMIVGNRLPDIGGNDAFVWTAGSGMRSLADLLVHDLGLGSSLSGWSDLGAYAVSDNGRYIAGDGFNGVEREAWLLDRGANAPSIQAADPRLSAVPEPATYAGAGALIALIAILRRFRTRNRG